MTTFQRTGRLVAVALTGSVALGLLGGCVSQQEYDDLWETNRSLMSRNQELLGQLDETRATADSLSATASGARGSLGDLESENARLRGELSSARNELAQLEVAMGSMSFSRLDPATDLALQRLAQRFPELSYDANRGMLRFSSDLTFDSGKAVVRDSAQASIAALAKVLEIPEAEGYDLRIVGHTDSEQPSVVTRQRHASNMHLSVHRVIAVRDALAQMGVPNEKMEVAGWGEFRPVVPNTPSGNTPANRRVEIYLVASSWDGEVTETSNTVSVPVDNGPDVVEYEYTK